MNRYGKLCEMPITSIKPGGWLRKWLENQRNGLTGHLDEAGYPFNTDSWSSTKDEGQYRNSWWPYEQNGYWVDGMLRCGYQLEDDFLIKKAKRHIDFVIQHQDEEGYLGPQYLKLTGKKPRRWAHAVFFRTLMAYYSATGDKTILDALQRHYFSGYPHSDHRDICNVEIILWLYGQTGEIRLLEYAEESYREFNEQHDHLDASMKGMLSDRPIKEHGVTFNEMAKLGAILYMHTGKEEYLKATARAYEKIDSHHMLIDGVNSSSEHVRGKDPLDSHETCDITDYSWSVGYLLMATGDPRYADKIERACFNAAPGAIADDFRALQYLSSPNQVVAANNSNHNLFYRGNAMLTYRPNPNTACCPGSVNRIMPNYVSRMWMMDGNGSLTATLYGPCSVTARVGDKAQEVTIVEETDYPFSDRIEFSIRTLKPVNFQLALRIPAWCANASLLINGKPFEGAVLPGTFATVQREFCHNDRITLVLPMRIACSRWAYEGIGLERGPLVYALGILEERRLDEKEEKQSKGMPAWEIFPASPWNYALDLDPDHPEKEIQVVYRQMSPDPWTSMNAPVELKVPARKVRDWKLLKCRKVEQEVYGASGDMEIREEKGRFVFTPQLPDPGTLPERLAKKRELVTLVPYGCTNLRITIFPKCR